ncbi:AsmA-like C-terminal domain-containing protein [Sulfurimonas sp.]|uniref:YhdP family protein n=1 Tax=Sulfurimonas sp. TaxID=2022749 RepID=UPI0039E2A718
MISAISTIYFIIISFLLFISLTLSVIFIVLQNGLFIENISTQNLNVKQLYIKWNESLDISIKEIKIDKYDSQAESKIELNKISHELSKLTNYYNIFEKISIDKIYYNDIEASFKYIRGENGYFNAHSTDFHLESALLFESHLLNVHLTELQDKQRNINVSGNIILNISSNSALADLQVNIHDHIDLRVFFFANEDKIFYKAHSNKDIKNISSTIALANLHPEVLYWADEAIRFSSISLVGLHGWIDFHNLDNAYKNIYAHAVGKNLKYKYNEKLDDIHTKKTDVIFKNGKLLIYPRQAHTYKSKLGKSWISVDFTQKEEQLSIKLLFDGKLDKDTLGILKTYKIKVPFLQNTGVTKVDLTINVNLRTIDVSAQGKFFTKKANFNYLGHNIDVFDAHIKLNDYDVSIDNMLVKYNDFVTTSVDVQYNAKKARGEISLDINKINFSDLELSLDTAKSRLKVKYIIEPNNDKIVVPSSLWTFKSYSVKVNPLSIPFDIKTLILNIPPTVVTSSKIAKANIYGSIDLNTNIYTFDMNIIDIYLGNISLFESSAAPLKIHYDENLTINTTGRIDFKVGSLKSYINKVKLEIKDDILTMDESYIYLDDIVKTKFSAEYSFKENKGQVNTSRLRIKTKTLGNLYLEAHDTNFKIFQKGKDFIILSKDLGTTFFINKDIWKLDIDSVQRLARNSKLLQKYNVTKGNATVYKKANDTYVHIKSTLNTSNKVMVKNNIPIAEYFINGKIEDKTDIITLNVNENIDVVINKDVMVNIRDIGINMNALADIINQKNGNLDNYSSGKAHINAKNTYLYISKNRHILSQAIHLEYADKALLASLKHRGGEASLKFKNGYFHIEGENFNDEFMENLFALSKFQDGKFKFMMSGTPREYDGLFTVENTTLLDYKVLNNILAFVNTIPALITFSRPNYNSKGLKFQIAYMKFKSKEDLFTISDIYFDSKELDILGLGTASFKDNFINMELNLKTDLGSSVSKVPLVGHLLMNKDSISTTLSITGELDNPDVSSLIAKDIAVAPLNILLRAITLPYYLVASPDKNTTNKK